MKIFKTLGKIILGLVLILVVLFGVGYLLTMGEYTIPETVAQDSSLPQLTLDGVIYHAETFGDPINPVVITVHGGPGSDYKSILNLKDLSDQYYVVFYDQRGAGLSPRVDPAEITLASSIADLDSIVDYYGQGDQVDLIGHSWGAMLVSAYLGQHSDKVDHAVLAEPGFLNSAFAERWAAKTQIKFTPSILYYFLKTKFESLHVREPDDQAANDYFAHQFNLYQGDDHPQAGYRCQGEGPDLNGSWRFGAAASDALFQQAVDSEGNFDINLTEGVEGFTNTVFFMTGECQTYIGADFQKEQMELFLRAELVVIPDAGHEMFAENSAGSLQAVREYLDQPAD
jgi:proline iminopeptidase